MTVDFPTSNQLTASDGLCQLHLSLADGTDLTSGMRYQSLKGKFPLRAKPTLFDNEIVHQIYDKVYPVGDYHELILQADAVVQTELVGPGAYRALAKDTLVCVRVVNYDSTLIGPFIYQVTQRRPLLGFENREDHFVVTLRLVNTSPVDETTQLKQLVSVSVLDNGKYMNDWAKQFAMTMQEQAQQNQSKAEQPKKEPAEPLFVTPNNVHFSLGLKDGVSGNQVMVSNPEYFEYLQLVEPDSIYQLGGLALTLRVPAGEGHQARLVRENILQLQKDSPISGGALLVSGVQIVAPAHYKVHSVTFNNLFSTYDHQPLTLQLHLERVELPAAEPAGTDPAEAQDQLVNEGSSAAGDEGK